MTRKTKKTEPQHIPGADSPLKDILCTNIKLVREAAGLTQDSFAEQLDTPVSYLKAVEAARYQPSHQFILKVADAFSVSIDDLYGRRRFVS